LVGTAGIAHLFRVHLAVEGVHVWSVRQVEVGVPERVWHGEQENVRVALQSLALPTIEPFTGGLGACEPVKKQ
jgi:hypothetical protein